MSHGVAFFRESGRDMVISLDPGTHRSKQSWIDRPEDGYEFRIAVPDLAAKMHAAAAAETHPSRAAPEVTASAPPWPPPPLACVSVATAKTSADASSIGLLRTIIVTSFGGTT